MSGRSSGAANDPLAALLRGQRESVGLWPGLEAADVVAAAEAEGVLPLLAHAVGQEHDCAPALRAACARAYHRHVAVELVREHELKRLIGALASADVSVLLMKGADLAYSLYSSPDLRARTDSDLLVAPGDRREATRVLESLGYVRVPQSGGDLLMYQEPFRLLRGSVEAHTVDLHWRVFNPQMYGTKLGFDELERAAEARPALASSARGLSQIHALVLACVHRVAHHFDQPRLIWLYDVHLLARSLTADGWRCFRELVLDRDLQAPCVRTLVTAQERLGTPVPAEVVAAFAGAVDGGDDAAFLDAKAPHALRVWSDFRHIDSWGDRARLARQHLFPPAGYMRGVYAPGSAAPLWTLYLNRIVRGTRRWIVKS